MAHDPNIWQQVLSPMAQAVAFFGALGGLVHAMALRRNWRETLRISIIGAITAFGFGVMSFQVLQIWFPELPEDAATGLGAMSSGAFFVGIVAVFLIERLIERVGGSNDDSA